MVDMIDTVMRHVPNVTFNGKLRLGQVKVRVQGKVNTGMVWQLLKKRTCPVYISYSLIV